MLEAGAEKDIADQDSGTLLHLAAMHGHGAAVQVLLATSAHTMVAFDKSCIGIAVESAKLHLNRCCWRPALTKMRQTRAVGRRCSWRLRTSLLPLSRYCLPLLPTSLNAAKGGERERGPGGAAYSAAERCQIAVLQLLLKAGADKDIADERGKSPLHWAAI